MKNKEIYS